MPGSCRTGACERSRIGDGASGHTPRAPSDDNRIHGSLANELLQGRDRYPNVSAHANEPNPSLRDEPPWKPVRGPQDLADFLNAQQPFHALHPLPSCRRLGGLVGGCRMTVQVGWPIFARAVQDFAHDHFHLAYLVRGTSWALEDTRGGIPPAASLVQVGSTNACAWFELSGRETAAQGPCGKFSSSGGS